MSSPGVPPICGLYVVPVVKSWFVGTSVRAGVSPSLGDDPGVGVGATREAPAAAAGEGCGVGLRLQVLAVRPPVADVPDGGGHHQEDGEDDREEHGHHALLVAVVEAPHTLHRAVPVCEASTQFA